MTKSIFFEYVDKYFKGIVNKFTELFNGKKEESGLMYENMLRKEYSPDLTWSSQTLNHSIVAADVVAMDSPLPLKKRGTISRASGDVPKIGMKKKLGEKTLSDIHVMSSKGQSEAQIAAKILENVPAVIKGIRARIEAMFLQGLSGGMILVNDENNVGLGIRVDFGYKDSNRFQALNDVWSNPANATPVTDIRQLFDEADKNNDTITDVFLSKKYLDLARKSTEMKELVANSNNQVIINAANLPMPTKNKALSALEEEFGATFHEVNVSITYEDESGEQTTVKPWIQGNVVGVTSSEVGRLVWGTLAEDLHRVPGVSYQKADDMILVSEYSHNEPSLEELTAGQALAIPVIDNGDHVYVLDANSTSAVSISPDSLEFNARGGRRKINVDTTSVFTAVSDSEWATVAVVSKGVAVTVAANSGASRQGKVTITIGDKTAVVEITQSAGNE